MAVEFMNEMPEEKIYLIPVKLDNCRVPQQFSTFQWIELQAQGSLDKIKQAINF